MRCWFRSEVTHSFETLQFCWALIFGQLSIIWWLFYCHTLQLFTVILTILMFSGFCAIWKSGLNVSSSNAIYHSGLNVLSNNLCFSYRCDFDQETADNIFQFRESFYCDQQVVSKGETKRVPFVIAQAIKLYFHPFLAAKKGLKYTIDTIENGLNIYCQVTKNDPLSLLLHSALAQRDIFKLLAKNSHFLS